MPTPKNLTKSRSSKLRTSSKLEPSLVVNTALRHLDDNDWSEIVRRLMRWTAKVWRRRGLKFKNKDKSKQIEDFVYGVIDEFLSLELIWIIDENNVHLLLRENIKEEIVWFFVKHITNKLSNLTKLAQSTKRLEIPDELKDLSRLDYCDIVPSDKFVYADRQIEFDSEKAHMLELFKDCPEETRVADFIMSFQGEISPAIISVNLNIPPLDVKNIMKRIRRKLYRHYRQPKVHPKL